MSPHPDATATAASSRPAPHSAIRQCTSVADLEHQLSRQLARNRRQGDQLALLWLEADLLTLAESSASTLRSELCLALRARLKNRLRRTDQIFQVGQTAFAVLLDADAPGAGLVERRLHDGLRGHYPTDSGQTQIHVSVGRAMSEEAQRQGISLLQCAIDDMYLRRPAAAAPRTGVDHRFGRASAMLVTG